MRLFQALLSASSFLALGVACTGTPPVDTGESHTGETGESHTGDSSPNEAYLCGQPCGLDADTIDSSLVICEGATGAEGTRSEPFGSIEEALAANEGEEHRLVLGAGGHKTNLHLTEETWIQGCGSEEGVELSPADPSKPLVTIEGPGEFYLSGMVLRGGTIGLQATGAAEVFAQDLRLEGPVTAGVVITGTGSWFRGQGVTVVDPIPAGVRDGTTPAYGMIVDGGTLFLEPWTPEGPSLLPADLSGWEDNWNADCRTLLESLDNTSAQSSSVSGATGVGIGVSGHGAKAVLLGVDVTNTATDSTLGFGRGVMAQSGYYGAIGTEAGPEVCMVGGSVTNSIDAGIYGLSAHAFAIHGVDVTGTVALTDDAGATVGGDGVVISKTGYSGETCAGALTLNHITGNARTGLLLSSILLTELSGNVIEENGYATDDGISAYHQGNTVIADATDDISTDCSFLLNEHPFTQVEITTDVGGE